MNQSKRTALAGVVALVLAAGSLSGCFGGDEECKTESFGAVLERPGPGGGSGGRGARSGGKGSKGSKGKPKPKPGGAVPHADDDCDDD